MELKLLYTYEEWLERKQHIDIWPLSEDSAQIISDGIDALKISMKENKTEEESQIIEEWKRKKEMFEQKVKNEEYTDLTHRITDMCLNPQDADIDFEQIGKLQFKLERLKYPVVKPY